MEATRRYHKPVAAALHEYGIYVSVLNPLYIKQGSGGSIRKVKTDKADAIKIAKYGLDNWVALRDQYNLYMKTIVALQNNLISLTDKTFPGVNERFSSPERADGHASLRLRSMIKNGIYPRLRRAVYNKVRNFAKA